MARLVVADLSELHAQAMREILQNIGVPRESARDMTRGLVDGTSQLAVTDFDDPPVHVESLSSQLEAACICHEVDPDACF